MGTSTMARGEDEWLFGWDATPGIVSLWAEPDGRVVLWRRVGADRTLVREDLRFRPWMLLASLDDLGHLGARLCPQGDAAPPGAVTWRALEGPGALRFVVSAPDGRALSAAVLRGASARLGHAVARVRDLGDDAALELAPDEQYLVATGRTFFGGLGFDDVHRLALDLETTGLDAAVDRVFLVALRDNRGVAEVLEARDPSAAAEAELLVRLAARVRAIDPDVIENHNLHGFDLPFLVRRARVHGVALALGRLAQPLFRQRPAARGSGVVPEGGDASRRVRYAIPGRELIDTLDAVRRYDFAANELPGHGLKAVARHLGVAREGREYVPGARTYEVYRADPERVRRYALDDVAEAAAVSHLLGGAAFGLARMAPRRYERLADAGPATGVLDPLLVRAYVRAGCALPAYATGDGTVHSGAALHLFATGVARRVVKADVASLYPSLMRQFAIGPGNDRLGALLAVVDRLVELRLAAKARARNAPRGSAERHTDEALSGAMKLLVNSAYGYLGAVGLTRFADVHAANEVTRRGRATLALICRELGARGVTLLEADTDGVYFAVPEAWSEADERRVVAEVAALLPPRVHLEFDGRYAAMLSHEPKNYALLGYDDALTLRGVAFRSRRTEPFAERFLRESARCLLRGELAGVRAVYVSTVAALRARALPTADVAARVRLTKTPEAYLASRSARRELPYEAALASGRARWSPGERVRVYRAAHGRAGYLADDDGATGEPPRDYDVAFYVRSLRDTFATRLARAVTRDAFDALFADPDRPTLFAAALAHERPVLTVQLAAADALA